MRNQLHPLSPPLPAPFDQIGAMVARWAHLEDELNNLGHHIDRAGEGQVCEVYPKASRYRWDLFNGQRSVDELLSVAKWLQCDPSARRHYENEHAFDALVCSLTGWACGCAGFHGPWWRGVSFRVGSGGFVSGQFGAGSVPRRFQQVVNASAQGQVGLIFRVLRRVCSTSLPGRCHSR